MGGQFWSAYISCRAQFADAVQLFMEQVKKISNPLSRTRDIPSKCIDHEGPTISWRHLFKPTIALAEPILTNGEA